MRARHKQIREELSGPDPTPIEALLAERAALDRLRLHSHECWYSFGSEGSTLAGCEHLERVRDRLHRRYLASLRTLASVRRMNLSGATFIVGGVQQVNLPGGNRPPAPVQDRRTIDVAVGE